MACTWRKRSARKRLKHIAEVIAAMQELPEQVEAILGASGSVEAVAEEISKHNNLFFIGRGVDYAVAQEGSLKLKEISYIHSEAYAAGELKHGTLALIEEGYSGDCFGNAGRAARENS